MNRFKLTNILNVQEMVARGVTCHRIVQDKEEGAEGRQNIVKSLRVPFDRQSDCMLLEGP